MPNAVLVSPTIYRKRTAQPFSPSRTLRERRACGGKPRNAPNSGLRRLMGPTLSVRRSTPISPIANGGAPKAWPRIALPARARILPALGDVELAKLTTKRICDWHTGLATAPKLVRTSRIVKKAQKRRAVDAKDADAVRARRATANRTLTVLKAALNHAFHDGRIVTDEAWRKVKPFREADAPVVHFLSAWSSPAMARFAVWSAPPCSAVAATAN